MKVCRVCSKKMMWTLKGVEEKDRHYCSLSHLALEVNEALAIPYCTPGNEKNAPFFKKQQFIPAGKRN